MTYELWTEVCDIVQGTEIKTILKKNKTKLNKAKQMYNLAQMVNKQTASFITIKEKYKILPVA